MAKNRNDRVRATSIDDLDFNDDLPQVKLSDLDPITDGSATDAVFGQSLPPSHVERKELKAENEKLRDSLNKALVQVSETDFAFRNFYLTRVGLTLKGDITEDDADALGYALKKVDSALQFWIGDWALLYLDDDMDDNQRGDVYAFLAEKFGIEHKTLNNYASICRALEVSRRRETLTFSHHAELAYLPESLQGHEEKFLDEAIINQWSVRQLREAIQSAKTTSKTTNKQLDTIIDTKHIVKQVRDVTKLFGIDVSRLSAKKKNEYRGKVLTLRRLLDDIEKKLDA